MRSVGVRAGKNILKRGIPGGFRGTAGAFSGVWGWNMQGTLLLAAGKPAS